ncbi:two component transcriptional regulator, LuxR family [Hymenobacter daecheongensis DSM 21074]|uniref:Two component transcriptional regulator, LuxR family n=1 Tax=Hymenobacter daecheongensis DSM 21074 TaxID=1121955 RepID=A0A1M6MCT6_9BACT|nr:response regulator transcription factor [Hymenobacter daecheongensis]SHJ81230.1 two component transcriptional regulator, LuxR family [Hymenobacter daecheongensis DSM 21074]
MTAPRPEPEPDLIQVLLVDDHQMIIEGIKTLLQGEADIRVVAQATSGAEALRLLQTQPGVNVAILDLNMPQMSGVELARAIHTAYPQIGIMALSMFHDHASVAEVLEAGGSGYLLKSTNKQELSAAIRQVAAGNTFFSPEVASTLLANLQIMANRDRNRDDRAAELTNREREILQLIAREYSNSHIAETLFISERTVETHRKNILTKTNSKSVVGLIQYALRHKLIV